MHWLIANSTSTAVPTALAATIAPAVYTAVAANIAAAAMTTTAVRPAIEHPAKPKVTCFDSFPISAGSQPISEDNEDECKTCNKNKVAEQCEMHTILDTPIWLQVIVLNDLILTPVHTTRHSRVNGDFVLGGGWPKKIPAFAHSCPGFFG